LPTPFNKKKNAHFQSAIPRLNTPLVYSGSASVSSTYPTRALTVIDLTTASPSWTDPTGSFSTEFRVTYDANYPGTGAVYPAIRVCNDHLSAVATLPPWIDFNTPHSTYSPSMFDLVVLPGDEVVCKRANTTGLDFYPFISIQSLASPATGSCAITVYWSLVFTPEDSLVHATTYSIPSDTTNVVYPYDGAEFLVIGTVGNPVPVLVENAPTSPVPVTGGTSGLVPIGVQGLASPTYPVWTSLYQ